MPRFKYFHLVLAILILFICNKMHTQEIMKNTKENEMQLIMRADDIGFSNAANIAIIKGYQEGVITSTEVLVPGPWFLAAAKLLRENPGLDAGVHLALTSEWDNYKWGPITNAPSLVTEEGYFPSGNDGLFKLNINLDEVENELRAQIELAKKYIPQISHLSAHMGTASSKPELKEIVMKLSKEYNLPLEDEGIDNFMGLWNEPVEKKETYLINAIDNLKPGTTVIVFHLSLDNEESRAIEGVPEGLVFDANKNMALHRQAETNVVIKNTIKQLIIDRKITLKSYAGKIKDLDTLN